MLLRAGLLHNCHFIVFPEMFIFFLFVNRRGGLLSLDMHLLTISAPRTLSHWKQTRFAKTSGHVNTLPMRWILFRCLASGLCCNHISNRLPFLTFGKFSSGNSHFSMNAFPDRKKLKKNIFVVSWLSYSFCSFGCIVARSWMYPVCLQSHSVKTVLNSMIFIICSFAIHRCCLAVWVALS